MSAAMVALLVDQASARCAVAALTEHATTLRQVGLPIPPGYGDLLRMMVSAARGRQEPTEMDAPPDLGDGAGMTPRLLTYAVAAQVLGCSERQVQRLASGGDLPAVQLGRGTVRIRSADLEAFIAALPTRAPHTGAAA